MTIKRIPITDEAQWHALREKDVTCSRVAALFNVHPYCSAYELYAEATGLKEREKIDNGQLRRGRLLEPVAIQMLKEDHPHLNPQQLGAYFTDEALRFGGTPDLIGERNGEPGVIQIKTVAPLSFKRSWQVDGEIFLPPWIAIQTIGEAYLTGSAWAAVAVMVVDNQIDLHLVDVPIHGGIIERLHAEVKSFWLRVAAKDAPPIDYGRDADLVSHLYAEKAGTTIDLSRDNRISGLLEQREKLKDVEKSTKDALSAVDAEIKDKIGEASSAIVPGWTLTFKTVNRNGYTVKPTSFRQLRAVRTAAQEDAA